jgi:RNA polymerase sigma-70 factor (ECF subfamily)
LVRQAQAGDSAAFRALLKRDYGLVYKVAYAWCGRREDAQDIAQEVCLALARDLAGFRFQSSFTSWLGFDPP